MNKTKMKFKEISLILICVLFVSLSCTERKKYVSAKTVEIEYWGEIAASEWITIDDLKFVHVSNDSIGECDIIYMHDEFAVNEANQSDDHYFLPSTGYYECLEGDVRRLSKLNNGNMANSAFAAIMNYGVDGNAYLYKNVSSTLELTLGKLRIVRTDGEEIRVSTSDNYQAAVRAISKEE